MKICSGCKKNKAIVEFALDRGKPRSHCKECMNERQLAYQKTESGKLAGLRAKMKYRYNITLEQYDQLSKDQGDACYLCGEVETVPDLNGVIRRLAVDHDHNCCPGARSYGKCIRSLLCYNCNRYMGRVDKSPKLQMRFADYLSRRALELL